MPIKLTGKQRVRILGRKTGGWEGSGDAVNVILCENDCHGRVDVDFYIEDTSETAHRILRNPSHNPRFDLLPTDNKARLRLNGTNYESAADVWEFDRWHRYTLEWDRNEGDAYGTGTDDAPVMRVLIDNVEVIGWTETVENTTNNDWYFTDATVAEITGKMRNIRIWDAPEAGSVVTGAPSSSTRKLLHAFDCNQDGGTEQDDQGVNTMANPPELELNQNTDGLGAFETKPARRLFYAGDSYIKTGLSFTLDDTMVVEATVERKSGSGSDERACWGAHTSSSKRFYAGYRGSDDRWRSRWAGTTTTPTETCSEDTEYKLEQDNYYTTSGRTKLFVDDVEVDDDHGHSNTNDAADFTIGARKDDGTDPWYGYLKDLKIYDDSLTLIHHFPIDEDTGDGGIIDDVVGGVSAELVLGASSSWEDVPDDTANGDGSGTSAMSSGSGAGTVTASGDGSATAPSTSGFGSGVVSLVGSGSGVAPMSSGSGAASAIASGSGSGSSAMSTGTGSGVLTDPPATGSGSAASPMSDAQGGGSVNIVGTGSAVSPMSTGSGTGWGTTRTGNGSASSAMSTGSGSGLAIASGTGAAVVQMTTGAGGGIAIATGNGSAAPAMTSGSGAGTLGSINLRRGRQIRFKGSRL